MSDADHADDYADSEAFRNQIRAFLRRRHAAGHEHVKCHHITSEFGVPIQKVSTNLGPLLADGTLSIWGSDSSGNANTYVIHVTGPDTDHPRRCDDCGAWLADPTVRDAHERLEGHDSGVTEFPGC